MRVMHFCRTFSPLSQTFVYDCITELERQGIDNQVAALKRQNADSRPFDRVHLVNGPGRFHPAVLVNRVVARIRSNITAQPPWLVLRRRLKGLVERLSPDLIHAHFGPAGVLISPVASRLQIPLVVTFYGRDISTLPRMPAWRRRYSQLWRDATAVAVLSNDMRADAVRFGCPSERIRIVHLARNLRSIPARHVSYPVRQLISVGRLVEKKGHLDTLRAFHRIAARHADLRLTIIGEGPLRLRLAGLIGEMRLQHQVSLLGAQPSARTLELMRDADAFVLCSRTAADGDKEGTPAALLEAQAIGLPCVATTHAGIPEMVPPENHTLLAPEGDVEGIVERLETLLAWSKHELQAVVTRGQRFIESQFDLAEEMGKLIAIYRECGPPLQRP